MDKPIMIHGQGMDVKYTMRAVAGMTGLSHHTIRAWERRYNALSPLRSDTNRRLYDDRDVERLVLLARGVSRSHSISQIAHLSNDDLRKILFVTNAAKGEAEAAPTNPPDPFLKACDEAMVSLDEEAFKAILVRSTAEMGIWGLLNRVVLPLISLIESRWSEGLLTIAQEHMASAVLRSYLEQVRLTLSAAPPAPRLLVTTPKNQFHEIGALIVCLVAAMHQWNVTYLGPNLPAQEIATAAKLCSASAIALSLVYPLEDTELESELERLRQGLGPTFPIFVGGRAAENYAHSFALINAHVIRDLDEFGEVLGQMRSSLAGSPALTKLRTIRRNSL